eukprot:1480794-Heterocapsa_arctica.AAC.1
MSPKSPLTPRGVEHAKDFTYQPWTRPLDIDYESDEEVQGFPQEEEVPVPQQGPLPAKRGLTFRIDRRYLQTLNPYNQEIEVGGIVESAIKKWYPSKYREICNPFWYNIEQFKLQTNQPFPVSFL